MEQGNKLEVRKIAEWNRLVNNDAKGLFKSLSDILISALNIDFGDAFKSGLDLVLGIASKENDELPHRIIQGQTA